MHYACGHSGCGTGEKAKAPTVSDDCHTARRQSHRRSGFVRVNAAPVSFCPACHVDGGRHADWSPYGQYGKHAACGFAIIGLIALLRPSSCVEIDRLRREIRIKRQLPGGLWRMKTLGLDE